MKKVDGDGDALYNGKEGVELNYRKTSVRANGKLMSSPLNVKGGA